MSNAMKDIQATANDHMRRDLEAGPKWVCGCEACVQLRSLVGVEKMLGVRPLVREIEHLGSRLDELPAGPERQQVLERYLGLHDKLANVVAE
jgi:hypothetical protein